MEFFIGIGIIAFIVWMGFWAVKQTQQDKIENDEQLYEAIRMARQALDEAGIDKLDSFREQTKDYGAVFEDVELSGLYYRPSDAHSRAYELCIGDSLSLRLDVNNKYDRFAVRVYAEDGVFLGYIPKMLSEIVHNRIVNDTGYVALVSGNDKDVIPHIYLNLYPCKPNDE